MLVYQSFGQFTAKEVEVYSVAQHVEVYREDLPTRRRQLNAINSDIDNMRLAIATIRTQQDAGQTWSRYLGDKYGLNDLRRLERDFANLLGARLEIESTPCPAKVAKEKAAQEAAQDEQAQPVRVTLELPAGFTLFDLDFIFDLARDHAHQQRMKAYGEYSSKDAFEQTTELFEKSQKKADYLSKYYNAAVELGNITHRMAWKEDPTTTQQCLDQMNILEN